MRAGCHEKEKRRNNVAKKGKWMKSKLNCWEFKECGRETGGRNAAQLGVCPAATTEQADGIHGGKAGGRCCWVTAGLSSVDKFDECHSCDFYELVRKEEHVHFNVVLVIMNKIKRQLADLPA